ncbi:hypothetical protein OGATHE_004980 [Ogataea polymorpha]|uniref:Uncharacterized protein n=1 Tax=Ogataea polymorpha TaxID=460523 RepID=A0A9P8SZE4_9ASCO|nr:hypothetical protein OGATHE_004980 [Ogataea polymorpha]
MIKTLSRRRSSSTIIGRSLDITSKYDSPPSPGYLYVSFSAICDLYSSAYLVLNSSSVMESSEPQPRSFSMRKDLKWKSPPSFSCGKYEAVCNVRLRLDVHILNSCSSCGLVWNENSSLTYSLLR